MTAVEIPNVEDIKKQIKELQELLVVAYRLDPKYRCPTCGGSGNVVTEYWSVGHAVQRIVEGCPDCLGRGYNIGPEKRCKGTGNLEEMNRRYQQAETPPKGDPIVYVYR